MVDFEKGNEMKSTEYLSVSEALEAWKKINRQEDKIFEYVKTQMEFQSTNYTDTKSEKQLKKFWDYVGSNKISEFTLPIFKKEAK